MDDEKNIYEQYKGIDLIDENQIIVFLSSLEKLVKWEEGLRAIQKYEQRIVKKYYEFTRHKISFLVQGKKYLEAKLCIDSELNVPYIPHDFESFLLSINKEITYELNKNKQKVNSEMLEALYKRTDEELLLILPHLKEYNLNPYLTSIQEILLQKERSNIIKSLFLAILSDNKINHEFIVEKEGHRMQANPMIIKDLRESKNQLYIHELINSMHFEVQQEEVLGQLINMTLLDHYPFDYDEEECRCLFYAALSLVEEMLNSHIQDYSYLQYKLNHQETLEIYRKKNQQLA